MEIFRIQGAASYNGRVRVQGSKNAVLPMLAASVINKGVTVIEGCPDISDVRDGIEILRYIGCEANLEDGVLTVNSQGEILNTVPEEIMNRTRGSVLFCGALLARCKSFKLWQPGGCNIGLRPVDIHLESFRRLGAAVETDDRSISCRLGTYKPCDITLRFPSVGATENIMIMAAGFEGTVRIMNAAREPEIVDLQNMLSAAGARITGAGTGCITVKGTSSPESVTYRVMPDRIVAATYLSALACSEGNITLENVNASHLTWYINILKKCGMDIECSHGTIEAEKSKRLKGGISVSTRPYPGFATDMQSLLMGVLTTSDGVSLIRENIFENRFCMASELTRMGADIRLYRRTASVRGVRNLHPVNASACDLRSGAALAIVLMGCEGESTLSNIHYIDRGYEKFCENFGSLGVHIERVETVDKPE